MSTHDDLRDVADRVAELEAELQTARAAIVAAVDAHSGVAWRDAWSTLTILAFKARALVGDETRQESTIEGRTT